MIRVLSIMLLCVKEGSLLFQVSILHDDVTGHLCGEFTGPRWSPRTKASDAELWCFFFICAWINGWVNNREAGDLRRHRAHYDVIIMEIFDPCYSDVHCPVKFLSTVDKWVKNVPGVDNVQQQTDTINNIIKSGDTCETAVEYKAWACHYSHYFTGKRFLIHAPIPMLV